MKSLFAALIPLILVGCASAPRVQTFKEAINDNPNLESGIYNKTNGENVQVTVVSLRAKITELEKQNDDQAREILYLKQTQEQLRYENVVIRAKGNYSLEQETVKVKGFDKNSNPVTETVKVNPEPPKAAEPTTLGKR